MTEPLVQACPNCGERVTAHTEDVRERNPNFPCQLTQDAVIRRCMAVAAAILFARKG